MAVNESLERLTSGAEESPCVTVKVTVHAGHAAAKGNLILLYDLPSHGS